MSSPTTSALSALPRTILSNAYLSTLLPLIVGSTIGWSTRPQSSKRTYNRLLQPPLSPPAWVFGPVWTVLYMAMGYGAHVAWRSGARGWEGLYWSQLVLNFLYMPLFFGMGEVAVAGVDVVGLTAVVAALCSRLWGWRREVWWGFGPYLLWCGFASYLTVGVGIRNGWRADPKVGRKRRE